MLNNGNYYCTKNQKPSYSIIFVFFWFFLFLVLILITVMYCQNFVQIDNVQQCHFQFFQFFWVILTPTNFSKNLKLRVQYFFRKPYNVLRGKKSKIAGITTSSIWAGMLYIYYHVLNIYNIKNMLMCSTYLNDLIRMFFLIQGHFRACIILKTTQFIPSRQIFQLFPQFSSSGAVS